MIRPGKRTLTATIALLLLLQTAAPALTTGLLSAMPWVIIGGGVFWYKRRIRELDEESAAEDSLPDQDSLSE